MASPRSPMRVVSEVPPTRVSINIGTPTGRHYRWGADESQGENVPSGVRWSSTAPGGFETMDCVLPRDPEEVHNDLVPLSDISVHGAQGTVGEYRLEATPVTSGNQMSVTPAANGWQAALSDNDAASVVFIDRDLSRWLDVVTQRKENGRTGGFDPNGGSFQVDAGSPAKLSLSIATLNQGLGYAGRTLTNPVAIAEAYYDAGAGNTIGEIRSDYSSFAIANPWILDLCLGQDAATMSPIQSSGALPLPSGSVDLVRPDASADWRYGLVQMYFNGAFTGDAPWTGAFYNLRVIGAHGCPIVGANSTVEGVLASDAFRYVIRAFCPRLSCDDDSVQPGAFIIPHLTFPDKTSPGEMVNQICRFGMPLPFWGVWNDHKAYLHSRGQGKRWRARISPANLSGTGPDMARCWNSVCVQWNDVDGFIRTAGPPGSGSDVEDWRLVDSDPENPATLAGIQRRSMLSLGITSTSDIAVQVGQTFLDESKRISRGGSATLTGHVQDDHGVLYPYHAVRADDQIMFTDAADTSYRYITRVDCSNDSRSASLSLDAPPDSLQGLLQRLGVGLTQMGLS